LAGGAMHPAGVSVLKNYDHQQTVFQIGSHLLSF
jgi:hypothetical protein